MAPVARSWPAGFPDELRRSLEAAYADPARGYHDLQHLTEVLEHVDELMQPDDPARDVVLLAAWFHDAVYDGRPDDEERSARLARASIDDPVVADEVARLVRLTADHRPADDDRAGQLLCDADLAILAADGARYTTYVAGVRREHAHVSDDEFAAGRAAVLRALLAKPTLFHTRAARDRWEAAARANLERELARLTAAPSS
jgi:predicted metal-dependent HD superfamily phosphohydrolase